MLMSMPTNNLAESSALREFFVWVDPSAFNAAHNLRFTGHYTSVSQSDPRKLLPFIPNPEFRDVQVSPFSAGLMRPYMAEYHLEIARNNRFKKYPSRLGAIFVLPSEKEAMTYRDRCPGHVGKRTLKVARTAGMYVLSEHDATWIEFLRLDHSLDDETCNFVADAYWRGINVEACKLQSCGKSWSLPPIREVLYLGAIEFVDRTLPEVKAPDENWNSRT